MEFGCKVLIKGQDKMGVIVHHHKAKTKQGWDKDKDTCDVRMVDGYKIMDLPVDELQPIEVHYIPLAFGLSLEDLCLYISCIGTMWASLSVIFGVLMFAHEETASMATALMSFFYMGIMFITALLIIVYIGRTLIQIEQDEQEDDLREEEMNEDDDAPFNELDTHGEHNHH